MPVAEGIKLNPDTPGPLQLPPTGVPTNGTSVSLIHILLVSGVPVTVGIGFTVRVIEEDVTLCPQLLVTITRYLLLFKVVAAPVIVNTEV